MARSSVRLQEIKVALEDLYLDPNNPRLAKSLRLESEVPDGEIGGRQKDLRRIFVNDPDVESSSDDDDAAAEEGNVGIGDLIRSMNQIGFVPIDRIVVRRCEGERLKYVVIEGNRRVSAAKYLNEKQEANPEARRNLERIVSTLKKLDVLLLVTDGLSADDVHEQIGVILGLRHYGQVLNWGTLARAVNIYNEYRLSPPAQAEFRLDSARASDVAIRLSETRSGAISALKTYIAYLQLQDAFPNGRPKPTHYSLLQACVTNRKLNAAGFIQQDGTTFKLSEPSLERLNTTCEFEIRDQLGEEDKILRDPKAVASFAGLVSDAVHNKDAAVRAFAASLQTEVVAKERPLDDAVDNLRSFKSDRVWTDALEALLKKVVEPGTEQEPRAAEGHVRQLGLSEFLGTGNDLLRLEDARKAFRNVRKILGI